MHVRMPAVCTPAEDLSTRMFGGCTRRLTRRVRPLLFLKKDYLLLSYSDSMTQDCMIVIDLLRLSNGSDRIELREIVPQERDDVSIKCGTIGHLFNNT